MTAKTDVRAPCISFAKAFAALSLPGSRLMIMHVQGGDAYFVIPGQGATKGGRVTKEDAEKIMQRANVEAFDDGLFPGHEQSWRIAR